MVIDGRNFGDSTGEFVSTEPKPVILIESESHLVANILSSILEVPIVIIGSTLGKYVRPFLPTVNKVPENAIIYLAHDSKEDIYYNTRDKDTCIIQSFIIKYLYNLPCSWLPFHRASLKKITFLPLGEGYCHHGGVVVGVPQSFQAPGSPIIVHTNF